MQQYNSAYWDQRAKTVGHTGHSEPFYYCFDQQARIYAVAELLSSVNTGKNQALDFGCGSGDFLPLLTAHFRHVSAIDVSPVVLRIAKQKYEKSNVRFYTQLNELPESARPDVIVTVTVLQSFTLTMLEATLKTFNSVLAGGGKIILMEFFADSDYLQKSGLTQPSREEWEHLLTKYFKIISIKNFYNPVVKPVKSWLHYKTHPLLLLLKPFKKFAFAQKVFSARAKKLIHRHRDVLLNEESPLKVYVVEKLSV